MLPTKQIVMRVHAVVLFAVMGLVAVSAQEPQLTERPILYITPGRGAQY